MAMDMQRWWRHATYPRALARRAFPRRARRAIAEAVRAAESRHAGEIRVAIEPALDLHHLWHGITPRRRAVELFSTLRVWDTEGNDGVLIYLLLADRAVEIVADRGIAARVAPHEWQAACDAMRALLRERQPLDAVLAGVAAIADLLAAHAPAQPAAAHRNTQSDWPILLRG